MALYHQEFTVTATGGPSGFPLDMLRYDRCWPRQTEDAISIASMIRHDEVRQLPNLQVRLSRWVESKAHQPSAARWRSFGWLVSNVEIWK